MAIKMTPLKAIKFKCIDCCCGQRSEVRACETRLCSCWPFRPGARLRGAAMDKWVADFEEYARKQGDIRANEGQQSEDELGEDTPLAEQIEGFEE